MQPYNATTTNPFLCEDCQPFGYCRKTREASVEDLLAKHYNALSVPNKLYHYMKPADIVKLVPVKTLVKDYYSTAGRKLQHAHDLFHQDEYEQASYLYRDLLLQRADYNEATIGLAVCYYCMKQYEEASATAAGVSHIGFDNRLADFLDACARGVEETKKTAMSASEAIQLQQRTDCHHKCKIA